MSWKLSKLFILRLHFNYELDTFQSSPCYIYIHWFFIQNDLRCIQGIHLKKLCHCFNQPFSYQEERILGHWKERQSHTDCTSRSVQMPLNHTLRGNMIHLSVWALRPGSLSSHQRDTSILPPSLSLSHSVSHTLKKTMSLCPTEKG